MFLLTRNSPISRWLQGWLSLSSTQGCSNEYQGLLGNSWLKLNCLPVMALQLWGIWTLSIKRDHIFCDVHFLHFFESFLLGVSAVHAWLVFEFWDLTCFNVFLIWGEATYWRLVWCLLWFNNVSSLHVPLKLNIDYYACQKVGYNIFLWGWGIYYWFSGHWSA